MSGDLPNEPQAGESGRPRGRMIGWRETGKMTSTGLLPPPAGTAGTMWQKEVWSAGQAEHPREEQKDFTFLFLPSPREDWKIETKGV